MGTSLQQSNENQLTASRDNARMMLAGMTGRAIEILQELAEISDNERVRLAAVNSILDRAGVVAPQEVQVSVDPQEHALVQSEVQDVMQRIQENVKHQSEKAKERDIETLMIHEGDEGS